MTHSIPRADVLLDAVSDYLEHDLAPTLEGYHRFQTRVAVNVLKTVVRELRLEPSVATGTPGADDGADRSASCDAELALASALRDGSLALDDAELVARLRRILHRQLAVDNPAWTTPGR